jgi:hypothetical protein
MSYDIVLSPQAIEDLARWSLPLQNYVEQQLLRLADNPAALSRSSAFPYPSHCQLFHPGAIELDGVRHEFTVLFRYSQDETSLEIAGIGHIERPPPPPLGRRKRS